jgi:hypothetical protein
VSQDLVLALSGTTHSRQSERALSGPVKDLGKESVKVKIKGHRRYLYRYMYDILYLRPKEIRKCGRKRASCRSFLKYSLPSCILRSSTLSSLNTVSFNATWFIEFINAIAISSSNLYYSA